MPTGRKPRRDSGNIYLCLRQHERADVRSIAVNDNAGFVVNLPHRQSVLTPHGLREMKLMPKTK
jgi:hypothetical protein